jgi:hypothetical protein
VNICFPSLSYLERSEARIRGNPQRSRGSALGTILAVVREMVAGDTRTTARIVPTRRGEWLRVLFEGEEALAEGEDGDLGAVAEMEFLEDDCEVVFDGLLGVG